MPPQQITYGPDGNYWFSEIDGSNFHAAIGRITPAGVVSTFDLPSMITTGVPNGIAAGPDGNVWFTESASAVGRISMQGQVKQFPITVGARQPFGIAAGPDGKVWMRLQGGIAGVARINTDGGGYTEFRDPDGGFPNQIAAGPDGNLWYVDHALNNQGGNQVGRVTPAGQITEFGQGLPANSTPTAITAGPDGRMWFTLSGANAVGAVTTR